METREVLAVEWRAFFKRFSRLHAGKRATVETMGGDLGVQPNARELPLVGITPEGGGGGDNPERWIEISLGDSPGAHLDHVIACPTHVRVVEWNAGFFAALQIEAEDGHTTLLRVGPQDRVLPPGLVMDDVMRPSDLPRC
jgi:hypothetical protein